MKCEVVYYPEDSGRREKVKMIKTIRVGARIGLKEAKEFLDRVEEEGSRTIDLDMNAIRSAGHSVAVVGYEIYTIGNDMYSSLKSGIKNLIVEAVEEDQLDTATALIVALTQVEFQRRPH